VLLVATGCAGVGGPKPGAPAHHREHGFANTNPAFERPPFWTRTTFFASRIWASIVSPRTITLPQVVNDGGVLRDNRGEPTVTWVGHATLLLQLDGVNVLTDPQWSERASPVSFAGPKRVTPPGLAFENLPPIHIVLISHDHYDHLDEPTVKHLAQQFNPRFVVPLGIKQWLADRGITNVVEMNWGESVRIGGLTVVCTPAQHGSGRTLLDQGRRLWASWAVLGSKRFYFAGDTGYYRHFKDIGEALGPFDLAAMPIGSYTPRALAKPVHMSPEEALQAWQDLRATNFLGIHWGTFALAREPYDEPPRRIAEEVGRRHLDADHVWILQPGATTAW